MTRTRFLALACLILLLGGVLRGIWLRADPPVTSLGIVFHDEGAWVHNARNRALWGVWRTDNWNPVYIAPVFTALEYAAFRVWGVGTWQARTVPAASGLVAIAALMIGLAAVARSRGDTDPRRLALAGGLLLAVNYTWVMWNRAALMESTMTAFLTIGWAAYALGARRGAWGLVAGTAAALAFFTKASAAFFAAALAADAAWTLALAWWPAFRARVGAAAPTDADRRAATSALAGMAATTGAIAVLFVAPHWSEFQFYNWQMTVLRKPTYDLPSLLMRASWLPVVHDYFTRMWPIVLAAALAMTGIAARWRRAAPAERLLVLWLLVGLLELTIHDSGNERRYVMFVPALVALASLVLVSGRPLLPRDITTARPLARAAALPLLLLLAYLVLASGLRPAFLGEIQAGRFSTFVRLTAALSVAGAALLVVRWPRVTGWLAARTVPSLAAGLVVLACAGWDLAQYGRWAAARGDLNYRASVALGELLPPGTLVHGKLANGLSLDNRIRPLFVGRGFGNYEDRFDRDDARYILTYGLPEIGRETQRGLMQEILDRYPRHRTVATFDVDETPALDQAWLIEKRPDVPVAAAASR